MSGQLSLFVEFVTNGNGNGNGNGHGSHQRADVLRRLRPLILEDGMTEPEAVAVLEDARRRLTPPATSPRRCRCIPHGMELDEPRCWKCGRPLQ